MLAGGRSAGPSSEAVRCPQNHVELRYISYSAPNPSARTPSSRRARMTWTGIRMAQMTSLPALQRQQDEQKSHGAEDVDGVAELRVEARRHELTCLRPDRERHPQLPACDKPENGKYHREAERHEPERVTHDVYEAERQEDQIEQEHDGIDRSKARDHVGR